MTTPRVTELPRRLESVGRDTFLSASGIDVPRQTVDADNVVALHPRTVTQLRPPAPLPPLAAA